MNVETKERELIFTRVFDAPRELVLETFSDCKHLKNWWGPREWPTTTCEMDFRVGGTWNYCMEGPEGQLACGKAVYKEITPEKIVYEDYFLDEKGNVIDEMPSSIVSYEFSEENGKTTMTGRSTYPTADELKTVLEMGVVDGMTETLDRLEEHLAAIQ